MTLATYGASVYIAGEQPDALPNGTRIVKVDADGPGETPHGTRGLVLSSLDARGVKLPDTTRPGTHFYYVVWDTLPNVAVGVVDWKIARA